MIQKTNVISTSEGVTAEVEFNLEELESAEYWYEWVEENVHTIDKNLLSPVPGIIAENKHLSFEVSSFVRARFFIENARKESLLIAKITNYISVLECLFAVKGENTHKVSERCAIFIGDNVEERVKIFNLIKDSYSMRSLYIHGSEIKERKIDDTPSLSRDLDDTVRKVLKKMIKDYPELNWRTSNKKFPDVMNFEEINNWFDASVLNGNLLEIE